MNMQCPNLFANAQHWAQERAAWLRLANAGGSALYNRRQCLARVRSAEWKVVDLAIKAEIDAGRAQAAA